MRWPVVLAIVGIGVGIVGEAAPIYLPGTPPWIWGFVFWAGIAAIIGAIGWGVWPSLNSMGDRKLSNNITDFNVPIRDLVRYVRFKSQWGVRTAGRLVAYPDEYSVLVILRNKAAADEIEIQGIREIQDSPPLWSVIWQDCRNNFPDYWYKMEFAPRCLLVNLPKEPETQPENPHMSPRYPDHTLLRACWSEILETWPRASSLDIQVKAGLAEASTEQETVALSPKPAREWRQTEAITDDNPTCTPLFRDWNIQEAMNWWVENIAKDENEAGYFFRQLRQHALDGEITVWGRKNCSGLSVDQFDTVPLVSIPAKHWDKFGFDDLRYIFGELDSVREAASPETDDSSVTVMDTRYADLRVTSTDIKGLSWHAVNT